MRGCNCCCNVPTKCRSIFPGRGACVGRLVFEDDVKFATGWRDRFLQTLDELYTAHGPHFILSLYSPHDAVNSAWLETEQLAVPYATAAFMGTQGVYFPEPVRRDFADYLRIYGVDDNLMPYDCLLENYCEQCQVPLFATVPSLVQHVGVQTTGLSGGKAVGHTSSLFVEDVTKPKTPVPVIHFDLGKPAATGG